MATVTGLTAARMIAIENSSVVSGLINASGKLILTKKDGTTIDAGTAKGAAGTNGLTPVWRGDSVTSQLVAIASKVFTISPAMNVPFVVGSIVRAYSKANANNYMVGYVTAATTVSVTINVTEIGGSGTFTDWTLVPGAFQGVPGSISVSPAGGSLAGNYPNPTLAPNSVSTATVTDGSITRAKLAPGAGGVGADLITPFLANAPLIIGHRGSHNLYPENSLEGMRETGRAGFGVECDLRLLSTGQAVLCHDATVDRTMTGTGTISTMTLTQWRALSIIPQIQNGQKAMGALWDDVLSDLGGRYLLVPEIKTAGDQDILMAPVIARNLQRAVIFQSFDLTTAQAVANAGCASMYLTGATLTGITPAALRTSGVEFLGMDSSATAANVAAAKAGGLKVVLYTVDTAAEYTTAMATQSADGVFTDDPWFVSGRYNVKSSDPFQMRDAWPHFVGYSSSVGQILATDLGANYVQYAPPTGLRRYGYATLGANATFGMSMGWAGQNRGPRIRVRYTLTFLEASSAQTKWSGTFIGTQTSPDDVFHDAAYTGQNGYHFLVRRSGILEIYRVAPATAPASIVASADPADLAAAGARSQPIRVEIVIDATTVSITNLNTGLAASIANTAYRGASRIDFTANGTDLEWQDIGVEDLV